MKPKSGLSAISSGLSQFIGRALMAGAFVLGAAHFDSAFAQTALVTVTNQAAFTITTNIPVPASGGTTYVLQKDASGQLTVDGQLTGGAGSILRTTTDTSGDATTIFDFPSNSPSYSGSIQLWRGVVEAVNSNSLGTGTIYYDGNLSTSGDLTFGGSMTFTNPMVLQQSDTVSPSGNKVILSGPISDGGSGYGLTVYGTGTLTLSGANTYTGGTTIGGSTAGGCTVALGVNNGLPAGTPLTIDKRSTTNAAFYLGAFSQNVGPVTFYAGSSASTTISNSTGLLALSSNVTLVDYHIVSGNQDYPLIVSAPMDLNGATRIFTVGYGNNAESSDLGDLRVNGFITNSSGTAGIMFTNYANLGTNYYGSVTLGAANFYNGPSILAGGTDANLQGISTLSLNANNAIPTNSAFIQSVNTMLDLTSWGKTTGISTGMGSLTGSGTITLGTAGVLTIGYDNTSPATYAGAINGTNGARLVKTGTGTLTFTGTNAFAGTTTINTIVSRGTLLMNGRSTGGTMTVGNGATLGGNGTITSSVVVTNNATLTAGNASALGTLTVNSLTLGLTGSDAVTVNCSGNASGITGSFNVVNANGLTNNGTVTVNVTGSLPATLPATYNLITYSGAVKGSGTFVLGTQPSASPCYVTNNAGAGAIQLVFAAAPTPSVTWVGSPLNNWDLQGSNVWKFTLTGTPTDFTNTEMTFFDDSAANFNVNIAANVLPNSVLVSNSVNNYVFSGNGGIGSFGGLTKTGSATLTLATTNGYTGGTTISAGTVVLGVAGAIPAGNVTVNGTLDVGGTSPTLGNLVGSGVVDNVSAGGSPVLNVSNNASSTFSGTIQNSSGTMALNLDGGGNVTLGGINTYNGGTTLANGSVSIVNGGGLGTGALNITENAAGGVSNALTVATASPVVFTNNLILPNASGTYVLTKNQTGRLTMAGTISGGGPGTTLRTSTDTALDITTVTEFSGTNSFAGNVQLFRGVVQVDNSNSLGSATILADANASSIGDLSFDNNSMTFANPFTLQSNSSISNANTVVMSGPVSGTGALTKYGPGNLTLSGALGYTGVTTASAGTLGLGTITLASGSTLSIAAGAAVQSSGTLNMNANASAIVNAVTGSGVLRLTATGNSAASPDIYFNANDAVQQNSTANYGTEISCTLDLGTTQRYIYGLNDHNGVGKYATSSGADCTFAGAITNTGGMTFIAQDNYTGSSPMETPFYLTGANTFTGPVEIQRGSVYLGNATALTSGNVLRFNPAAGNNAWFYLYGHNASVSDLQSPGAGNALIADGNLKPGNVGPGTLTITQNNSFTYGGTITDTNSEYNATSGLTLTPTLSLVKNGPAALTLTGPLNFSGTVTINTGKLYFNTISSGGGAVTVTNGGTLGGSGTIVAAVTVANGSSLEAGSGSGSGALTLKTLTLGNLAADVSSLYVTRNATPGIIAVTNNNGLVINSGANSVTINVGGNPPPVGQYPLITYKGTLGGTGYSAFKLGSLPPGTTANLVNDTANSSIDINVTSVVLTTVSWVGSPTNNWDLLGSNVWDQFGTSIPTSYADGDVAFFGDAASDFSVNLAATVSPYGVIVSNNVNSYSFTGAGGISGQSSLTKQGAGAMTLSTTNSYVGATTISAGKLVIGSTNAIPSGTGFGNVTVNGTLDINGLSPTLNNLSGGGVVDNVSAGGLSVLNVLDTSGSTFSGVIQNSSGMVALNATGTGTLSLTGTNTYTGGTTINPGSTVQVGAGGTSGTLGPAAVLDNNVLSFNRSDSNNVPNDVTGSGSLRQNGTGIVTLTGNLTYTGPTLVNAGTLYFPNDVTFDAGAGTSLTIASNAFMQSGFVLTLNGNSSSVATDASGQGTLQLVSVIDRIESWSDITFGGNNNGVSTLNLGIRLASGLNVGSIQRLIWGISSENDVTRYGLGGADAQFAGPISGTAEMTLLGKNSFAGVNTMEEPFVFSGSNSWTGTLEVQRGSVYLGNPNALTAGNVLILDPAASVNSRLFLFGFNASVSDLQSGGYGTALIANGNNLTSTNVGPATLTLTENNPTAFAGNIVDWYTEYTAPGLGSFTPTLSLVKNGLATLTLSGANTYSGITTINAGKLYINTSSTGGGAITVNASGTLGGAGIINSPVTVKNGGAVETGDGTGNGNLQVSGLTLGSANGDQSTLNLTGAALLSVTNNNGLVMNGGAGSVTINVGGSIAATGAVPLITYKGTLGGTGFAAFQLGALPAGVTGSLSNSAATATIYLVVSEVTIPRWSGSFSTAWSTNTIPSPKNWVLDSDGVTPLDYLDGENVKFDDTAASTAVSISAANVAPVSVTVSNVVKNYTINGAFGITGATGLTKQGAGMLTLGTPDSYTGGTLISSGTLTVGAAGAIPGGAGFGNLTVNGTLDLGGFSPTVNNLSGSGTVDNLSAGGSPVLTVNDTVNPTFAGSIRNSSGTVGVAVTGAGTLTLSGNNAYTGSTVVGSGTLTVNGSLAGGGVTVQNGANLGGTGTIGGAVAMSSGTALNLTANQPLTVGALALNGSVSVNVLGTVSVTNTATYVLLDHGARSGSGSFLLGPVAGIATSGFTATLNDTNNQLLLVVAPTQPTGTIADVKHVVIFMQENRAFDHYFGSLHGVHGFSDHIMLTFTNGNPDIYQPSGSSYELPFHTTVPCLSDLDHSWSVTHQAIDNGKNDAWVAAKGTETMAFYNRSDIPYYYSLADNFTICDEYHCATLTSTDPNRVFFMTGWNDPDDLGGGPLIDNTEPAAGWGTNWGTYPQLLLKAGVSFKIYQASDNYDDNALNWFAAYKNAAVGSPLYNNAETFAPNVQSGTGFPADYTNLVTEFKGAVMSNTLPSVSYIIGPDVGSEHPSWSPEDGEILTKGLLDALASNPKVYNSTVFILNYDENDGFFDHAVPINPPAGTANEFDSGLPYGLGIRVPCIVISPWSTGGYVCSQVFDHTSITRFLEKWTGVQEPNISAWRRQVCGDLTSAFDFTHVNTNYPSLLLSTENDCPSGTTASPPGTQTVPTQESGTLLERPLPYQPNATPLLNCGTGNFNIVMTNWGTASVHFSLYPNAYRNDGAWPYDVASSNSTTSIAFSTSTTGGKYDFSAYGPNGFLRRFGGNLSADCGQIEAVSYLNGVSGGVEVTLANATGSAVVFSVTNGYFANGLATYTVPASSTNVVLLDTSTNNGWYDLTARASSDPLLIRRFAGHVETNNAVPTTLASSKNASGYRDNVTFTATMAGFGTPTGTLQFETNGVAFGAPVALVNGSANLSTTLLPRGSSLITAAYSGDTLNLATSISLTQVVTNHPPVAGPVIYQRPAGIKLLISASDLLTNVTDVDGDPITLTGVGTDGQNLLSTNGVNLATNGTFILYTNSVTPNVNDSFNYAVSDGQGGTALGAVYIIVNSGGITGQNNVNLNLTSTNVTANFFGVPGDRYTVDRSTNLSVGLGWVPISTNIAPSNGLIQVIDNFQDLNVPIPPLPSPAFYRLRYTP